jgi:transcriptional regulator with XRE-family HTH domain
MSENSLREVRNQVGMSQAELAERAGMHAPDISDLERGKRRGSVETWGRIADALGVPVGLLVPAGAPLAHYRPRQVRSAVDDVDFACARIAQARKRVAEDGEPEPELVAAVLARLDDALRALVLAHEKVAGLDAIYRVGEELRNHGAVGAVRVPPGLRLAQQVLAASQERKERTSD